MAKNTQAIVLRDFSRGTIRTVQNSIAVQNSVRMAMNMDSDIELGSYISRKGTDIVGVQTVVGGTCFGLHYHRDTVGVNHKLFGVFSSNGNNDIYDMLTGTKSLEDDWNEVKTRFCTYLGSTVRVNGVDAAKSYNGSAWVTSGGAFDEANMPKGSVVIEWLDRIYTAGVSTSPNVLYYSSIADPDSRTIDWTEGTTDETAGNIPIEQEDGGGAITALQKVPGYLLIFKERAMKRWDGSSTFPDDLINVGTPSQEATCYGRGMVFFGNQEGLWITNGGYPKKISKPIQDLWDLINPANIAMYCDESYVYIYVGDITQDGNVYSNIMFKYNIDSQTFDTFSYYNDFTCFTWYLDSNDKKVIIFGDKNGQALELNTGNTDYSTTPKPIYWSVETQDLDLGLRGRIKEITNLNVLSNNVRLGQLFYRSNSNRDVDWKSIRNVTSDIENVDNFKAKGNYFNFKIQGLSDSGQVKLQGLEIPEGAINTIQNTKE